MALRKRTYRKKSTKKRNLGKKSRKYNKCCACCKCKCSKCSKKKVTRRNKQRGGSQFAYYKYNNQTPAPRDFLTSSRIHGCAGGSRKQSRKIKRGGSGSQGSTLFPQHLVNVGRGLGNSLNGIKSGFLGVDSKASPYPTQDQPIDHKLTGAFTYTPTNIRNIRSGAERKVGKL
jgi:hypothetical protein